MGSQTIYEVTDQTSRRLAKLLAVAFSGPGVVTSEFRAAGRRGNDEGTSPEISAPK